MFTVDQAMVQHVSIRVTSKYLVRTDKHPHVRELTCNVEQEAMKEFTTVTLAFGEVHSSHYPNKNWKVL